MVDRTLPHVAIQLRKRGVTAVDARNFQGVGCSMATKRFADMLGGKVVNTQDKAEMHEEREVNTVPVATH